MNHSDRELGLLILPFLNQTGSQGLKVEIHQLEDSSPESEPKYFGHVFSWSHIIFNRVLNYSEHGKKSYDYLLLFQVLSITGQL